MAAPETRDFLGMLDCHHHSHYPAHPDSSSSSSSSSPLLQFSLRLTESDCAERACEEAEAEATTIITAAPINDSSTICTTTSYSGSKRSKEQSVLYGGNENANVSMRQPRAIFTPLSSSSFSPSSAVKWQGLMYPLLRGSTTPLRTPLSRKASLTRFFRMRNEREQNLRLKCLELRTSQAIDVAHPRFEPNAPSAKRQCVHS